MGQTYGLDFRSHEVFQDNRTGLALGLDHSLCAAGNMELAFEVSFIPNQKNYFGYLVRVITDDGRNIDLIYDYDKSPPIRHFRVVIGDTFSGIVFDLPGIGTEDRWHTFRLQFNRNKGTMRLLADNQVFEQPLLLRSRCFKLFFGANDYLHFKNSDVPPMMLRNIRILENNRLQHYWPLNEAAGSLAADSLGGNNGMVTNAQWVTRMRSNWQQHDSFTIDGAASVAFSQEEEALYIVGRDSLFRYFIPMNKIKAAAYSTGPQAVSAKYQSFYNPADKKIYLLTITMQDMAVLDPATLAWDRQLPVFTDGVNYCHFNKYYSPSDSSLYTFNGYGFFLYKSNIYRYHVPDGNLQLVDSSKTSMTPRYLAALGAGAHGAYIMGGYGSASGRQVLNPRNLYDLDYFDVRTHTIKKVYDLKTDTDEFVFGNSLVVDEPANSYYGLIFPKHKFDSELQLIKGSLTQPVFEAVGDKIPYRFHDIRSYADVFYDSTAKRFVVPTLFYDEENNRTTINIYTLYGPPLPALLPAPVPAHHYTRVIVLCAAVVLLLLLLFIIRRRRRLQTTVAAAPPVPVTPPAMVPPPVQAAVNGAHHDAAVNLPVAAPSAPNPPAAPVAAIPPAATAPAEKVTIHLFGDFQVRDAGGEEVTRLFTPLIRELFLVILLYSIRWERGISSEKLKEILWSDKSAASARNNRSVNIAKLKNILERIGHIRISKDTGYWKIDIDYDKVDIDYSRYLAIMRDKGQLNKTLMAGLADIIQRGSFLTNDEHEWLDVFKSEISNEIIDTYMHFASSVDLREDPDFLIKLANYVYYFDPVNEDTMSIKCKSLAYLGKHSLARDTFEHFGKEYKRLYGEDFEKNFQEILE
ncbi:MAG TPA: hypothetical protein VFS25_14485 [Chitinophaga sp.]|uniref:AfsR/SARP family transcriptional regulator n=1 Tax=Chitinophaga sp. TaxID=1869181 RepID=UPI002DB8917F|nr:hypothetical protein [Chitinophaga sp.]HEU4554047.1 hypothetical protein [Chitinophaga sp.]